MAGHHAYMRKEKGSKTIVKVALNKWAQYRRSGYDFATEEEYAEQQAAAVVDASEKKKASKKVSKKKN